MRSPSSVTKDQAHSGEFVLIEDNAALASACERWRRAPVVVLDTEFERTATFYPRPALLQLADTTGVWLIDPLAIDDYQPLAELLTDPGVTKVLHSAGEDLSLFIMLTGVFPVGLFDTQIAAALVGHGFSLGYRRLVEHVCSVQLDKQETRSNWLRRPLTRSQLRYAVNDVLYLPAIHARLAQELAQLGREQWLDEECDALIAKQREQDDTSQAYLRIGQAWRLDQMQLARLRALCSWREHEARRRDVPRAFLLKDESLLALARTPPATAEHFHQMPGLGRAVRSNDGDTLVRLVNKVAGLATEQLPALVSAPVDTREFAPVLKQLKHTVRSTAERLDVAPELLGHRRALERQLLHTRVNELPGLTDFFSGWRKNVVGDSLLQVLQA